MHMVSFVSSGGKQQEPTVNYCKHWCEHASAPVADIAAIAATCYCCFRIIKKTESAEGRYSEQDAALIVKNILSGIAYCHTEHNICHRDLKVRVCVLCVSAHQHSYCVYMLFIIVDSPAVCCPVMLLSCYFSTLKHLVLILVACITTLPMPKSIHYCSSANTGQCPRDGNNC
jgi:serine/threonine protein kinase